MVKKVQDILRQATKYLYPTSLAVTVATAPARRGKASKKVKGNGGWSDHRDRTLCMNMALPMGDEADVEGLLEAAARVKRPPEGKGQ